MSKSLKNFDVDGVALCRRCETRPINQNWPGMCEECGRRYFVGVWSWVCEYCETYIDPEYPEDVKRLKNAVLQLATLGEQVPVKAIQMLRKMGISPDELVRRGAA